MAIILSLTLLLILCLFMVLQTYVWHPWSMMRKSEHYRKDFPAPDQWPKVAILVAAYNEELVLDEKIRSTLGSNYPGDWELVIGSDCSTDGTDEIVTKWVAQDKRIKLSRFESRTGKPGIINQLVKETDAEIVVLSDADTYFFPETLTELVKPFAEDTIGGVQAWFESMTNVKLDVARQELGYNQRELQIKKGQSVEGAVIGAYGACYAIRKKAYVDVPPGFKVDDFFIFMKVLEQGYRTVLSEKAKCKLDISGDARTEFQRKVRIGHGNYQNLKTLSHFRNPFASKVHWYYWSYKVMRWLTPFCLPLILFVPLIISLLSIKADYPDHLAVLAYPMFYFYLFQIWVLGIILLDIPLRWLKIKITPLRYASHFLLMNLALIFGFLRFLKGGSSGTWR